MTPLPFWCGLALGNSAHGAGGGTGAAVDAGTSVNDVLAVALGDGRNRAGTGAGATADTSVADHISHW